MVGSQAALEFARNGHYCGRRVLSAPAGRCHQPVRRPFFGTFQLRVSESPARARVWLIDDVVAPAVPGRAPTERVEVLRSMIGGLTTMSAITGGSALGPVAGSLTPNGANRKASGKCGVSVQLGSRSPSGRQPNIFAGPVTFQPLTSLP